jgi:radical SAM superfamily enzyme YgiQ (UPF0313 family)
MKTVYFFQPQFSYSVHGSIQYWLPYTAGSLWEYAKYKLTDWQLGDIIYRRDDIDGIIDKIDAIDLACFCTYVWNKEYNIKIAKRLKEKFPNVHISFGGPQVTKDYLDFSDSVCLTEGEVSVLDLMTDISQGNLVKTIYNSTRMPTLQGIPSPYTSGLFDKMIADNPDVKWSAVFETNRGCPYSCSFCEWGGLISSKVFQFDMDRIVAELEWFAKNPIAVIFIADANFGIFKQRDLEIAAIIRDTMENNSHLEYISMNYPKNSNELMFEIAKTLGNISKGITLSTQSMNQDTLKVIKRQNMKVNNFKDMLALAHKYNTYTYTELILGLPLETKETWKSGVCDLIELGQHNKIFVQKGTLLPNTEWNVDHREEYDITTVKLYDFVAGAPTAEKDQDQDQAQECIDLVVSTNTMDIHDMTESWMYSWMCEQMHYNGYSQIISKYLRIKYEISFRKFYDKMFEIMPTFPVVKQEFHRIKKTHQELLHTGNTTTLGIRPNTIEIVSRKVFFNMHDDAIALAIAVGRYFAFIPDGVIKVQERFLNNSKYTVPYTITLDINFETMNNEITQYTIMNLDEYIGSNATGKNFPRGTIERNRIITEEKKKQENQPEGFYIC